MKHDRSNSILILFVAGIILLSSAGCSMTPKPIISGPEPSPDTPVAMYFQPMQCEKTPWQEWYEGGAGGVRWIKEPTEEQLIPTYYGFVHQLEITNVSRVESGLAVCEACGVCSTSHYFRVFVRFTDTDAMRDFGWTYQPGQTRKAAQDNPVTSNPDQAVSN